MTFYYVYDFMRLFYFLQPLPKTELDKHLPVVEREVE